VFPDFDPSLFGDPEFKEDSVREVIIAPILRRLGYSPSGEHRVVRSKILSHPFIYAGTRKLPIKMIPDYTLKSGGRVVLVLDAKQPREDVLSRESIQQVYSYAIHPEVKSEHFALCNGKRLVVFNVDQSDLILVVDYHDFENAWEEIEKYPSPRMLREPILRRFAPDFGCALARLGLAEGAGVTLLPASFNLVARLDEKMMTASANVEFAGKPHCVSFDFERRFLPSMLSCLPDELAEAFSNALERAPFQAAAELAIELDLQTKLGPEIQGDAENFRPLIVQEVISSHFKPLPLPNEANDIPAHIFRLRKAFLLRR
jgi:hypothetical protein